MFITQERIQSGIFFRNPFFKKQYDVYCPDSVQPGNVYETRDCSTIMGAVNRVLNLKSKIEDTIKFIETNDDAAGYNLMSLRTPIYFKREVRTALYETEDLIIKAEGFNYVDEPVGGVCVNEKTTIFKKTGNKMKKIFNGPTHKDIGTNKSYNMVYRHKIEEFLKNGNIG